MLNLQCAICGKKERVTKLFDSTYNIYSITSKTFSARRTPDRIHYQFNLCTRCGLIFSSPIIHAKKIDSYYKKSDFSYEKESLYLARTYLKLFNTQLRLKKKHIKLLDIGCGNGFFLSAVQSKYVDVFGVEPGKNTVLKAPRSLRNKITLDNFHGRLFKKNTFDVICCFHTLDHIVDVNKFIKEIYQILKPGGSIFFVVHDTDGLSVKLFKERSPIFDIEHIYLFNKKTLRKILKMHLFNGIQIFPVRNTYPLYYWLRMSPLPIFFKANLLRIVKLFRLENIPLSISAGNIGVVAFK